MNDTWLPMLIALVELGNYACQCASLVFSWRQMAAFLGRCCLYRGSGPLNGLFRKNFFAVRCLHATKVAGGALQSAE